jgi:hypothetical protein
MTLSLARTNPWQASVRQQGEASRRGICGVTRRLGAQEARGAAQAEALQRIEDARQGEATARAARASAKAARAAAEGGEGGGGGGGGGGRGDGQLARKVGKLEA